MEERIKKIQEHLAGIANVVQQLELKSTEYNVQRIIAILNTIKIINSNLNSIMESEEQSLLNNGSDEIVEVKEEEV